MADTERSKSELMVVGDGYTKTMLTLIAFALVVMVL